VKPLVAIDIDGTIGAYHRHFVAFAQIYLGQPLPQHYWGDVPFWQYLGLDLTTYRQIKLAYRQGGMKRSMPLLPGARALFDACKAHGAEVWITTTRPYLRLDNVDPDTQHWLQRHKLNPDFMLYDEDKYGQLSELVDPHRVVAIVDDLAEQWDRAAVLFGSDVPIMAYGEHNQSERRYPGWTLDKVALQINQRLIVWKEEHEQG
jgi:hypothetical protein